MSLARALLEQELTRVSGLFESTMEDQFDASNDKSYSDDNTTSTDSEDAIEESYMAIAEMQYTWNSILENLAFNEMANIMDPNVVLEGAGDTLKKMGESIKGFFKKIWDVVQRWAANVSSTFTTDKTFVNKYAGKIRAGYTKYYSDKSIDRIQGYPYTGFEEVINIDSFESTIKPIGSEENTNGGFDFDTIANYNDFRTISSMTDFDDRVEATKNRLKNFNKDALLKKIRGSEDKIDLYLKPDGIIEFLGADNGKLKKSINKIAASTKNSFNKTIKALNKLELAAGKAKSENDAQQETNNSAAKRYMVIAELLKEMVSAGQVYRSCVISCINGMRKQYRSAANLYVRLANKDKYKGFQSESSINKTYSNLNLI